MSELTNTAQVDGRTWYSYESAAGDVFSVVRPEIGGELEREMTLAVEGILLEETLE